MTKKKGINKEGTKRKTKKGIKKEETKGHRHGQGNKKGKSNVVIVQSIE
jgi:hypothetical protein